MTTPLPRNHNQRVAAADRLRGNTTRTDIPTWMKDLFDGFVATDETTRALQADAMARRAERRVAFEARDLAQKEMAKAVRAIAVRLDATGRATVFPTDGTFKRLTFGPAAAAALGGMQSAELARQAGLTEDLCDDLARTASELHAKVQAYGAARSVEIDTASDVSEARRAWDQAYRKVVGRVRLEVGDDHMDDWLLLFSEDALDEPPAEESPPSGEESPAETEPDAKDDSEAA